MSVETGLYGVAIGGAFFGESMFSLETDASKVAFACFVRHLQKLGFQLIDCQVYSTHLASLGAEQIPRDEFVGYLEAGCRPGRNRRLWQLDTELADSGW